MADLQTDQMIGTPTVARIARHWDEQIVATHSMSCWQWHPRCAIHWLVEHINALEEQVRDLSVETDRMRGRQ